MTCLSNTMAALGSEAAAAPPYAICLSQENLDRLVEAAGVLVGRDQRAADAQPEVAYFRARLASSRALLTALHKHQRGIAR